MRLGFFSAALLLGMAAAVAQTPALRRSQMEAETEQRNAEAEKARKARDARFDAEVKRVTGSVCVGCTTAPAARPRRAQRAAPTIPPSDRPYDTEESEPLSPDER